MKIEKLEKHIEKIGDVLVSGFHLLGLFIIGGTIVWAAAYEYILIIEEKGAAGLEDILLLFIYLELGAMVGIYFKTNRLPVRFLLYIGITALTRTLVVDIKTEKMEVLLIISGAILILTLAILILGYGSNKFTSDEVDIRSKETKID